MSDINWNKIKADYIKTDMSQEEIATKYSVPRKTVQQRAAREKWRDQRNDIKEKIGEKVAEKSSEAIANQIIELKENERKDIELLNKAISKILNNNKELNASDVNSLSRARKNVQDMYYKSFGIADKQEIDVKGLNIQVIYE